MQSIKSWTLGGFFKNKAKLSMKVKIKYPADRVAVTFKNKKSGEEQVLTFRKYWDTRYAAAG